MTEWTEQFIGEDYLSPEPKFVTDPMHTIVVTKANGFTNKHFPITEVGDKVFYVGLYIKEDGSERELFYIYYSKSEHLFGEI